MNSGITSSLLQLISAAVTPVVMISACAALILGINNKHTAISDRIRGFAAECRAANTPATRKAQLEGEACIFYRRFKLTWYALGALYCAVGMFTVMVLLIVFTQRRALTFENGTLFLFILGIVLMMIAALCELIEIRLSLHSLYMDMQDVFPSALRKR